MIKPELIETVIAELLQGHRDARRDMSFWTTYSEADELVINVDADCTTYTYVVSIKDMSLTQLP
jgi:hypothetical protein